MTDIVPTIAGLVAAHINDEEHLECFRQVLLSIQSQTSNLDAFGLSWSCNDKLFIRCNDAVTSLKNHFREQNVNVLFHYHRKRSQFRHYESLFQWLSSQKKCVSWIIFGDSDDLWSPQRVEETRRVISNAVPLRTLVIPYYIADASFVKSHPVTTINEWITHFAGCPDGGFCEHVPIDIKRKTMESGPISLEEGSYYEYFQFCIPWSLLVRFFEAVPEFDHRVFNPRFNSSLLDCKYCDLALGTFIQRQNNYTLVHHNTVSWFYLKTQRDGETNQYVLEPFVKRNWEEKVRAANFPNDVDLTRIPCTSIRSL